MRVLVLDKHKQPLMPCKPARARQLLRDGKAAVYRRFPFTIILKERSGGETQPVSVKLDPGSKTTGIALIAEFQRGHVCVWGANLSHRGHLIKDALDSRRSVRRSRRNRKTRYRAPRFLNRTRTSGWLAPSLMSRVHNIETWTKKLMRFAPVIEAHVETARFDMQLLENPDIQGIEYQQGTLMDWEIREYLLYQHKHTCAYCGGVSGDLVLEKEHVHPRSLGGTNRLKNLVLACRNCNIDKGNLPLETWLITTRLKKGRLSKARVCGIQKVASGIRPALRDAAAVNATRYVVGRLIQQYLPTAFWSGGRTKKNRSDQGYNKDHWIDAACVGESGSNVILELENPLIISAKGHGSRQMCRMDRYGFPRTSAKGVNKVKGFRTGDIVIASVPSGKKVGVHKGRVAVRATGSFNITTPDVTVQGISFKHCSIIHRRDGYSYQNSTTTTNGGSEIRESVA